MSRPTRPLTHPRDEIVRAMERIYRYRMTTTSGGNLSIRDESGDVWITPARVDKGSLRREDVVRVRSDGGALPQTAPVRRLQAGRSSLGPSTAPRTSAPRRDPVLEDRCTSTSPGSD